MQLRQYQQEAHDSIIESWDQFDKALLVLPTGTGKTIVFCKVSETMVSRGSKVLILAHRGELLEQARDKMQKSTGLGCSLEKAESSCLDDWFRITVGSVQTLMNPSRLAQFKRDHFDVIIVDEAHHALADSYQRIFDYFIKAKVLGVTATPDRGDMRELGNFFESLAYEYTLPQAIRDGFLVKMKALTVPLEIDLTAVAQQSGDFKASDVATALDPYLHQIVDEIIKTCSNRKTVVFLPLIATSEKMQSMLLAKGVSCAEINGNSKDRAEILEDFHNDKYKVLCNSMLLTEGWDEPSVDCIICLRPTKVRSLYCQMIGRGTRLYPGKENLLILDFLWHTDRHELCRPAHLIADDSFVSNKITEILAESGTELDLEDVAEQAAGDCIADREEALAKKLEEMRRKKAKLVDPVQFEMSVQSEDLAHYEPSFGWEMAPPSEDQKKYLEKAGIFPGDINNAGKASKIIDRLKKRSDLKLTTPKQIRFLEQRGFIHVGGWKFEDARRMTNRIAGNSWKIPAGINPKQYNPNK